MTVRQALGELERDGRVRRVVGRSGGTFVREPDGSSMRAGGAGISAELRRQGGATSIEPISAAVEPAGKRVAAALELQRSDRVVVITRLRLAAGKPLAVERSTLPTTLFPDVEDLDLATSLLDLMAAFGVRPVRSLERLELTEARPSDARALGVRRERAVAPRRANPLRGGWNPGRVCARSLPADRTRVVVESTEVAE